ncbi:MAG TPA: choice-of-anchor Q domain-containing protein, partial [Pyrinomonadaceae bacterium]|nr:choice-of-anchor Q domain-containing protein [Pyrinomonadaceae bacterium]
SGNYISISEDFSSIFGAGIFIRQFSQSFATLTLTNSTVTGNRLTYSGSFGFSTGSGIYNDGATVNARNSIIAGNTVSAGQNGTVGGPDFRGNLTSQGYNLIGNTQSTTITGDTMTNILNQNARHAPLGFYGGTTQTPALLSGSPAIHAGTSVNAPPTDQRGASRIGNVDIGAFERNNSTNGGNFVAELPRGTTGVPYNYTLVPNNGAFTYSQSGGTLPTGINLTTALAPNAVVAVGGTAMMGGIYNFEVTATDGANTNVTNYRVQFLAPVAAGVSIGGRVMSTDGRGIRNAIVVLTLASGETIQTRTGTFGYFRFDDIEVGQTVVVSVFSKRFQFTPQIVSVAENIDGLDFIASNE